MKYALNGEMSAYVDKYTIEKMGLSSLVLMERAALSVATKVAEVAVNFTHDVNIAVVCGCGNNGADGIAVARILSWQGLKVDIIVVGDRTKATEEFLYQEKIAINSGLTFGNPQHLSEYYIVIDAIFGVGLKRDIEGSYADIVNAINAGNNYVISVDIPSGICASTGQIRGVAVKANSTITFGYHKIGMLLYPGREYAGEVTVSDIGFNPMAVNDIKPAMYFVPSDLRRIPERLNYSNKGTYLRTFVIAGSEDMSGAAFLSAKAAYRCGVGIVEIFSHYKNSDILKKLLPEAIVTGYSDETAVSLLVDKLKTADIVILGPGLSTGDTAVNIVKTVLENVKVPLIIDADALNIISSDTEMLKSCESTVIITPHIGEMTRLTGMGKDAILGNIINAAKDFSDKHNVICVLKDAATIVTEPNTGRVYINTSGCGAMSKAGCGDVLTGVIAAMISLKLEPFSAAAMGVYVHGIAGERAVEGRNEHSLLASDMIDYLLD